MLAEIVFAAALGSSAGPSTPPANVIEAPRALPPFRRRPTTEEVNEAFPPRAPRQIGGRALLGCSITPQGRLAGCAALAESPAGLGFGSAALRLANDFQLADDPGGPTDLAVDFPAPAAEDKLLVQGPWTAAPGFADMISAYPDIGGGVAGDVVLQCDLARTGRLETCKAAYQNPPDRDFGKAALKLAPQFRMALGKALLDAYQPMTTEVRFHIPPPFGPGSGVRRLTDPQWLEVASPTRLAQLFPAAAAAKAIKAGVGSADCFVTAQGGLVDCVATGEADPAGLGFSRAAALAAPAYRMSPWTNAGGPVDGARVRISVRFAAPGGQARRQ